MIKLSQVNKVYKTGSVHVEALKSVDLEINRGELLVLSGVSGSGKSTLLNILGAMDRPTGGQVIIDGEDISLYSNARLCDFRAKKIGFIFQSFNLIPVLNIYENIVVPMKLKGQKFQKDRVMQLIELVGLKDHYKHRPDELSGGQRQRVAIARAIVNEPPYILADEPTANLDSKTAKTIIELLEKLNADLNVTIIFASHDPLIQDNIGRKILLRDGQIA